MDESVSYSGRGLIRILEEKSFQIVLSKGNHVSLRTQHFRTVVPLFDKLANDTLSGILKQCGLDREDLHA